MPLPVTPPRAMIAGSTPPEQPSGQRRAGKERSVARVSDLLSTKGAQVWTIGGRASVRDAALVMNEHKIGALVVLDEGRVAGMFTERDVLRRVVAEGRDPAATTIADVMTKEVVCCTPETSIDEARTAMRDRRIRHLPVVDSGGKLHGLVSIGDLNAHEARSQEQTIGLLNDYLYGRV
jgi:CBS domain-containing protein